MQLTINLYINFMKIEHQSALESDIEGLLAECSISVKEN